MGETTKKESTSLTATHKCNLLNPSKRPISVGIVPVRLLLKTSNHPALNNNNNNNNSENSLSLYSHHRLALHSWLHAESLTQLTRRVVVTWYSSSQPVVRKNEDSCDENNTGAKDD